jgi:hypothetical protein
MGTRGCIAIQTQQGIKGVYHHRDSYPTRLGKSIWDRVKLEGVTNVIRHVTQPRGDSHTLTSQNIDPVFIEWIYVIHQDSMTILNSINNALLQSSDDVVKLKDAPSHDYSYVKVARVDFNAPEPNWKSIENILKVRQPPVGTHPIFKGLNRG